MQELRLAMNEERAKRDAARVRNGGSIWSSGAVRSPPPTAALAPTPTDENVPLLTRRGEGRGCLADTRQAARSPVTAERTTRAQGHGGDRSGNHRPDDDDDNNNAQRRRSRARPQPEPAAAAARGGGVDAAQHVRQHESVSRHGHGWGQHGARHGAGVVAGALPWRLAGGGGGETAAGIASAAAAAAAAAGGSAG